MFSNERSDLKYNVSFTANGLTGHQGDVNGVSCFAETQIRVELAGFGVTSAIEVQVRLRSSSLWTTLGVLLANSGTTLDVSTYDYIRYVVTTVDGIGTVIASGFFIKPSSGGGGGAVTSVNTKIGAVVLVKSDIGLGSVDNTSDVGKPVSTAQATAIGLKQDTIVATTVADYYRGDKTFQALNKTAVGLPNVDNTSDVNKPVSIAQALYFNYGKDIAVTSLLNF
jgi:hypothetical protein